MESHFACQDNSLVGIAAEIYCVICDSYSFSRRPVSVSGKWKTAIKYIELKGFITSQEDDEGTLWVIPRHLPGRE